MKLAVGDKTQSAVALPEIRLPEYCVKIFTRVFTQVLATSSPAISANRDFFGQVKTDPFVRPGPQVSASFSKARFVAHPIAIEPSTHPVNSHNPHAGVTWPMPTPFTTTM